MHVNKSNMLVIENYTIIIYIGKDESLSVGDRSYSHAVVLSLLEGLEGRGHHVYKDNYYIAPALFNKLRDLGFGACGTVRVNLRGLPPEIKVTLAKGDMTCMQVDESMMALKWMDKRPVSMLSTIHDNSMTTKVRRTHHADGGQEEIRKPVFVEQTTSSWVGWIALTSCCPTMASATRL